MDSRLGREVVEILAYGSMQYMHEHGIPFSQEGFDQLVQESRNTGIGGRIAYMMHDWTLERMKNLFAEHANIPKTPVTSPDKARERSEGFTKKLLEMIDGSSSNDSGLRSSSTLSRLVGPEIAELVEVFREGDCQRHLVWEKIQSIIAEDDPMEKLEKYKQGQS